jgi:hypothetical protein
LLGGTGNMLKISNGNIGSSLCESQSDTSSNTSCTASDERDLSIE